MMDLFEAAQATGGTASTAGHVFTGISTDSRSIAAGELFIALRGERFDGHQFVTDVLAHGATAAMVDAAWAATAPAGLPLLVVADTRLALGALASHWRQQFDLPVIGITGSNGKTTVKEMCAAILREHERRDDLDEVEAVLATRGNLNNDIGLPQMLLRLHAGHRAAVFEMGMNHPGEIAYLTRLARPAVAVVNNAQRAHLLGLGSVDEVARAKGEIFLGLDDDGVAVINADDPHAGLWRQLADGRTVVTFGLAAGADVTASVSELPTGSAIALCSDDCRVEFELPVPGLHNVRNALAATAACLAVGASLGTIAEALSRYRGVRGRLMRRPGRSAAQVIDDTYNANPDSMRAAIDVLAGQPGRRLLVIGDMGEIGPDGAALHEEVGAYARERGIDGLLALGPLAAGACRAFGRAGHHFADSDSLIDALRSQLDSQTTVLVKGSRFMRMERIVDAITEEIHAP
jgi:UDP-N-acetylmuramoyl-tripeptide--D-alanyl-D-alanine ligase